PAHMSHLVRTESGPIHEHDTISLETIEKAFTENRHRELLLPMVKGLKHLDTLYVDESTKKKVLFGQKLPYPREQLTTNPFKVMHGDQLLAVYQIHPQTLHEVKPVRVFNEGKVKVNNMRTIKLTYPHILTLEELPETVCAIGFLNGIYKGSEKVSHTAIKKAKANQMESAVITLHPHPSVVMDKGQPQVKYITPMSRKQEILQQLGVDRLYVISFNHELASLTPQQFIDHFIIGLNIKHLVAGFDFTYGHKGQGNMDVIAEHAKGAFTYTTIDEVQLEQEKISSTKIRKLLASGDVETVKT